MDQNVDKKPARMSIDLPPIRVTFYTQFTKRRLQSKFDEKCKFLNFTDQEKQELEGYIRSYITYGYMYSAGVGVLGFAKKYKNRTKDLPPYIEDANGKINDFFFKRNLQLTDFVVRDFMAVATCYILKIVGEEMRVPLNFKDIKV